MNILMFHLMPYADLDAAKATNYPASWVTMPNSLYDPKKGADLYNRYLDELEYAESSASTASASTSTTRRPTA